MILKVENFTLEKLCSWADDCKGVVFKLVDQNDKYIYYAGKETEIYSSKPGENVSALDKITNFGKNEIVEVQQIYDN